MSKPMILEGRMAKCYCGATKPSSPDLQFFEYRGEGSPRATRQCECGYFDTAHAGGAWLSRRACPEFKAVGPADFDLYYCGCRGWD